MKPWTEEEVSTLKSENNKGNSFSMIGELLGRNTNSVRRKAQTMGIYSPSPKTVDWTTEDEQMMLQLLHDGKSNEEIANFLNRTKMAVSVRLCNLGVLDKDHKRSQTNLVGRRFGKLTVVEDSNQRLHKHKMWRCECDCGNEKLVSSHHLTSNAVKSCGCSSGYESGDKNPFFKGYKEIHSVVFRGYQRGAKSRNLEFNVTIEQIWELYVQQGRKCAVSGLPIAFTKNTNKSRHDTASLDRIDSSRGYTIDNVQWVHKEINTMKMNIPQDRFLELCRQVHLHNSK